MGYSLLQISDAIENLCVLGGDKTPIIEKLSAAEALIKDALSDMDGISVAGRSAIDTILGCMMALESIIGKEGENGR